MSSGRTSVSDLWRIANESGIHLDGILQFDQIPDWLKSGYYIFNLHPKTSLNGHWVCARVPDVYFDSFGVRPPNEIKKHMNRDFVYNNHQIQGYQTNWCGQYCMAFLHALQNESGSVANKLSEFVRKFRPVSID